MENTELTFGPENGGNGAYYQQDFDLEAIDIITGSGTIHVRNLVLELSFFEDIYSFVVSGHIVLTDALGLMEKLKIDGNEYVNVVYGKTKKQANEFKNDRKYRIYKISDKTPIGNHTAEFLTIYFCSEELMLSEQIKISKSYCNESAKPVATSKDTNEGIINQILNDFLKVRSDRIEKIEPTYGVYDFIIPRLKPFEAISWLSLYARPNDSQIGSDMLFFETKDGFNFRSLQSMYGDPVYASYKWQPKNANDNFEQGAFADGLVTILDLQFIKTSDALNETSSGTYANKLISIDTLTKSYKVVDYSYDQNYLKNSGKNKPQTLNKNPVIGEAQDKLGLKPTTAYESAVKVVVGNSNQTSYDYVKEKPGSVAKDIFIETWVPYRTSQIALANHTILKLLIPGDSDMTAGKIINLNIFSLSVDSNNNRKLDEYFSGKYIVSAVRHIIQSDGKFQTVMEIAKESSVLQLDSPNSSDYEYQRTLDGI